MHGVVNSLQHAATITSFVFAVMVLVDYVNVLTRGRMSEAIKGGLFRQYVITSFLGATPGCLGAFMNVSFYVRGLISFGAVAGGMVATSGDEAFVMLAMFPGKALLLFVILFFVGIVSARVIDKAVGVLKIRTSERCELSVLHETDKCRASGLREVAGQLKNISLIRFLLLALLGIFLYAFISGFVGPSDWDWKRITFVTIISITLTVILTVPEHYLEVHIWEHIAKRHLWRVFLWSFGALLVVHVGLEFLDLPAFIRSHMVWILLIAVMFGLIPESGPHLIFVVMFAKGLIPFSVLLASSIVQDGHGILPLLSHSVKDSVLVKAFNLIIGLLLGLVLYLIGL